MLPLKKDNKCISKLKNSILSYFSLQKVHQCLHESQHFKRQHEKREGEKGGLLLISVTKELSEPGLYEAVRSSERGLITHRERKHLCEVFLNLRGCDRTSGSGSISSRESRGSAGESHGSLFLMRWSKGHCQNTESLKNYSCHESRLAGETEELLWLLLKVL